MKVKFVHPIWTNLPSFAALIVLVVAIFTNGPFPASVAIHFGIGGKPNAYGSPWSVFGLIIGISVLFGHHRRTLGKTGKNKDVQLVFPAG
jgi:uncharacterized membrane protein